MKDIFMKLDQAIDEMDMASIEKYLELLDEPKSLNSKLDTSRDFADRIIQDHRLSESADLNSKIKKSDSGTRPADRIENFEKARHKQMGRKQIIMLAATLVLGFALGAAGFASGLFNVFKVYKDSATVEIHTSENLSDEEIDSIVEDTITNYENGDDSGVLVEEVEYIDYQSVSDAEAALGLKLIQPEYVPEDLTLNESITVSEGFDDNHNIYLTYESSGSENRMMGLTIATQYHSEEDTVISITDTIYEDDYVSKSGQHYTILNEDTAKIYVADLGHLQYGILFVEFDDSEMQKIVDSLDLSAYSKAD